MGFITELGTSVVDLIGQFAQVASTGPLMGLLLLVGAVLTGLAAAGFGYLAIAGVISALLPDTSASQPPQAR